MPPDINWNESAPPTTASAGLGAQEFQSLKTALRSGLDAEHTWASSGLGVGVHRLGSARAYYGPQSLVSSSGTDGRLMVTSDTSRLFHVGSAGTMLLGSANMLSVGSAPVGGSRFYWATEFGEAVTSTPLGTVSLFYPSAFSGVPFVQITPRYNTASVPVVGISAEGPAGFTATSRTVSGTSYSAVSFYWQSTGTRTV